MERVAVIGGGISGLAYARVLARNGYSPIVFERGDRVGGVWATTYPGVRLQNLDFQYHLSDTPWPEEPAPHPTGAQIRDYWSHVVDTHDLDVRLRHRVRSVERDGDGWRVQVEHDDASETLTFDRLVVAVGQFSHPRHRPGFPGQDEFRGTLSSEADMGVRDDLAGERIVVVGFGKSALDVATLAAKCGARVDHVFRTPRWVLPTTLLGLHSSWFIFNRFGSAMMPAWGHPTRLERWVHGSMGRGVEMFWRGLGRLVRNQIRMTAASDRAQRRRLAVVEPSHPLLPDMRSAVALEPDGYFHGVAGGDIEPHHAELARFDAHGVHLSDGTYVEADRVVLALGSESPSFPFLPDDMRETLEREPDGVQLYRHLIHPDFPDVGFAGFNHGFLHLPAAELGAQWMACVWRGEMTLPSTEEMTASIERMRAWKRAHIAFEPSRSCGVNTRFQQHIDVLCKDLGINPYRKLPNVLAEVFGRYGAADYAGIVDEVRARPTSLRPIPVDA